MGISVTCPRCQKVFLVPEEFTSQSIRCTECHSVLPVSPAEVPVALAVEHLEEADENVFRAPQTPYSRQPGQRHELIGKRPWELMMAFCGIGLLAALNIYNILDVVLRAGNDPGILVGVAGICVEFLIFRGLLRRSHLTRILAIVIASLVAFLMTMSSLVFVFLFDDLPPQFKQDWLVIQLISGVTVAGELMVIAGLLAPATARYFHPPDVSRTSDSAWEEEN